MMRVPTHVKVISVLHYIGAALSLIVGILMIAGAGLIGSLLGELGELALVGTGVIVAIGVVFIAFAVLYFFIGRGLWKLQSWARIVAVVLAILGFIGAIMNLASAAIATGIVGLLLYGYIAGYLLFAKDAKRAFK